MIVTMPIKERRVASYCDTSRRCSSDRYSKQTVNCCCCCPPRFSGAIGNALRHYASTIRCTVAGDLFQPLRALTASHYFRCSAASFQTRP